MFVWTTINGREKPSEPARAGTYRAVAAATSILLCLLSTSTQRQMRKEGMEKAEQGSYTGPRCSEVREGGIPGEPASTSAAPAAHFWKKLRIQVIQQQLQFPCQLPRKTHHCSFQYRSSGVRPVLLSTLIRRLLSKHQDRVLGGPLHVTGQQTSTQTHTTLRAGRIDQLGWEAGKEKELRPSGQAPFPSPVRPGRTLWPYLVSGTHFRLYTGRFENPPHSTLKSLSGHRP